jgi:hypothetical protein
VTRPLSHKCLFSKAFWLSLDNDPLMGADKKNGRRSARCEGATTLGS